MTSEIDGKLLTKQLTVDHNANLPKETQRILSMGGMVY